MNRNWTFGRGRNYYNTVKVDVRCGPRLTQVSLRLCYWATVMKAIERSPSAFRRFLFFAIISFRTITPVPYRRYAISPGQAKLATHRCQDKYPAGARLLARRNVIYRKMLHAYAPLGPVNIFCSL